jgi:hypothetical protein
MQQAATDACSFVAGMSKGAFLADKRTQQAVIMSLIIIGEADPSWMKPRFGTPSPVMAGLDPAICARTIGGGWPGQARP